MATTIITKHGTGVPSSLAVGELAIDKSGPTLYTNAGSGVEAFSSGGGGGSFSDTPLDLTEITLSGTIASKLNIEYPTYFSYEDTHEIKFKPSNSFTWGSSDNLIITAGPGKAFKVRIVTSGNYDQSTAYDANLYNSSVLPMTEGRLINVGGSGNDMGCRWNHSGSRGELRSKDRTSILVSDSFYVCQSVEIKGPIGSAAHNANVAHRFMKFKYCLL